MNWTHLEPVQLVDYFAEKWTDDQQSAIESHLSECDPCAELASRVYVAAFGLDEWTAKQHADVLGALEPAVVGSAIVGAGETKHSQVSARFRGSTSTARRPSRGSKVAARG